jgi:hypothetical protein
MNTPRDLPPVGERTGRPRGRTTDPAANPGSGARFSGYAGRVNPTRLYPRPLTRDQRTTIVYGILCFVVVLVILQLWLLIATMNAYLGGDTSVIWPAFGASAACLLLNLGLLRYLYGIERS